MASQQDTAILKQPGSRWKRALAWFNAIDEALAYDPQEEAFAKIRHLSEVAAELETRVAKLEYGE